MQTREPIPQADIDRARSRLDVIIAEVPLRPIGRELRGQCPFHEERTASFYVVPDKGFFHCFGCGAHGSAIDFVMRSRGLNFPEAVRELCGLPQQTAARAPDRRAIAAQAAETSETVQTIVAECSTVRQQTAAFMYLHSRGLEPSRDRMDRLLAHPGLYCHEISRPLPALVAPISGLDGVITAIQRIWVLPRLVAGEAPDSRAPLRARKKTLGQMGNGAVWLDPLRGPLLGLAEGVESALAAGALYGIPVAASCGVSRLASIAIPEGITDVVIFGDNGENGRRLANLAAEQIADRARVRCEAQFPPDEFSDFADQLLTVRPMPWRAPRQWA